MAYHEGYERKGLDKEGSEGSAGRRDDEKGEGDDKKVNSPQSLFSSNMMQSIASVKRIA